MGFSFCSSIDGLYRYVINNDTQIVQKYDMVGNLLDENVPLTNEIQVRAKPCHCIMMVDLISNCKARLLKATGEMKDYTFSVALFKAFEMLRMLLGKDIRFNTQTQKNIQGIDVAAFLLCITDTVDIEAVLNKIPH